MFDFTAEMERAWDRALARLEADGHDVQAMLEEASRNIERQLANPPTEEQRIASAKAWAAYEATIDDMGNPRKAP